MTKLVGLWLGTAGLVCFGTPDVDQLKRLSVEESMGVEVTSVSRSPLPVTKAPFALQVITDWEIRRSGATSLPEASRLANVLNVARKNSHVWDISARGFNTDLANKPLVMIDGRAVHTPLWSGVRWGVQDYLLEDVDRIEVVSGPGGSLRGANAVNGVINAHYTGWEVEPSLRAQRDIGRDNLIWAAISRGVRTPSRIVRDLQQPNSGVIVFAGSNRFESERLIAYEVGLRGQLSPKVAGFASIFYNDYGKIRSLAPAPGTLLPFVFSNEVEGHSYGLELSFNADLQKWWRFHGGYTFLRTDWASGPVARTSTMPRTKPLTRKARSTSALRSTCRAA